MLSASLVSNVREGGRVRTVYLAGLGTIRGDAIGKPDPISRREVERVWRQAIAGFQRAFDSTSVRSEDMAQVKIALLRLIRQLRARVPCDRLDESVPPPDIIALRPSGGGKPVTFRLRVA
jgi:hypothetical protein